VGIQCGIFAVLFQKWYNASPRYYSDLPFILALSSVILIYNHVDSILGVTGIMPITDISQFINLIGMLTMICLNLVIMLIIYLPDRKKLRTGFLIGWFSMWIAILTVLISTIGVSQVFHTIVFMMSLPIMLLLTITWFFCHFKKRLSVINPLLVGIAFTLWFISIILRIFITSIGTPIGHYEDVFTDLHWIAGFMDIATFTIMLLGFSREVKH